MSDLDFEELDRVIQEMSTTKAATSDEAKPTQQPSSAPTTVPPVTKPTKQKTSRRTMDITPGKTVTNTSKEDAWAQVIARRKQRAAAIDRQLAKERKERREQAELSKQSSSREPAAELTETQSTITRAKHAVQPEPEANVEQQEQEVERVAEHPSDKTNSTPTKAIHRVIKYSDRLSKRALQQPRPIEETENTPVLNKAEESTSPFLAGVTIKKAPLGKIKSQASQPKSVEVAKNDSVDPDTIDSFIADIQTNQAHQKSVRPPRRQRPVSKLDQIGAAEPEGTHAMAPDDEIEADLPHHLSAWSKFMAIMLVLVIVSLTCAYLYISGDLDGLLTLK